MVGRHGGENDDSFTTCVSFCRLPCFPVAHWRNRRERRRRGNDHRVRRGEPDRRSGEAGPAVQREHGNSRSQDTLLLRGLVHARPADRGRGAGGHLHFGQRRMDGLSRREKPDRDGDAREPRRQCAGDDRPRRQPARTTGDRPSPGHRCTDRPGREDRHRRSDQCSGRHVRQECLREAGPVDLGGAADRSRRQRSRGAGIGGTRRSAARHRLRDRCQGQRAGQGGRRRSRRTAIRRSGIPSPSSPAGTPRPCGISSNT